MKPILILAAPWWYAFPALTITRNRSISAACIFATAIACAACAAPPSAMFGKIDFELTGTVLDADSKEPIEGAYVVASYKILRSGLAATNTFCVDTKGIYTGPDGKYHLPVEKLDGLNPAGVNAIKSGYFWKTTIYPEESVWLKQDAKSYSGRDIHLRKQDPTVFNFRLGDRDVVCDWAPTKEAAAAGVAFLKLELAEVIRFGRNEQVRSAIQSQIERLESLPAETDSKK